MSGGQDRILWSLSLEGADDVSKKLKAAGDVGDAQAKRLKQSFAEVGKGSGGSSGFESFKTDAEGGERSAERFREAIHVLHPVLEQAGLGLGNLGAFARVAGAGLGALGVAIAGSLLVGLAKIGEESDKTGLRLKALGVSGDTFEKLKQQAKELGTATENLVPSLEKFAASKNKINADQSSGLIRLRPDGATEADQSSAGVRVLGRSGQETGTQVPDSVFLGAQKALIEGAQGEKLSGDEAGKIADAFASKLLDNRKLTPEAVDTLNPASQNNLAKSLSAFFGTTLSNGAELKERLARPGQQAPSDREVFRSLNEAEPAARAQAEAARGVTAAFDALTASTKRLAEEFSGDIGLAGALEKLAKLINGVADNADKIIHPKDYQPGGSKFIGPVRPEDVASAPKSLGEVFSSDKGDLLGRLVSYIRGGENNPQNGFGGANPFGAITDFTTKALTNPGSFQEKTRPGETAPTNEAAPQYIPPPKQDFQYIPPPKNELQYIRPDTNSPRSEAAPIQQIGSLESVLSAIAASINGLKGQEDLKQTGPSNNLGIRGEAPLDTAATNSKVADLGAAAEDAAAKLRGVEAPASTEQPVAHAATGGHILGPGTSTSDSIPAMLSDGEYVLKKKAVDRVGVSNLNAINSGVAHFADGGLSSEWFDPNLTPQESIDLLAETVLNKEQLKLYRINQSTDPNETIKLINRFIMKRAGGGLVGTQHFAEGGVAHATFADRISQMGLSSISIPHLAIGGMPDMPMADLSKSTLDKPASSDMEHWGKIDLSTNHGEYTVATERDTMRHLSSSAQRAKRFSTGAKPSWYGGG